MGKTHNLDVLIAENVMGWDLTDGGVRAFPPDRIKCPDVYMCPFIEHGIPHYATDIADAWKVVDKLVGDGFTMDISQYPDKTIVGFFPPGGQDTRVFVGGPTISHAICYAALKAVGVDIDNL